MRETPDQWAERVLERAGPVDATAVAARVLSDPAYHTPRVSQLEIFAMACCVLQLAEIVQCREEEASCPN
jgi:hypothetical protein